MKIVETNLPTNHPLHPGNRLISDLEERARPTMGWGKCTECSKCKAYVSDSAHDGHCICGHTAASHE